MFTQTKELKINTIFYINQELVKNVEYYLVKNNKAYLLPKENDKIILKDTFSTESISLMAMKDKHKVVFPVYCYRESDYIKIYYDNRLFGNITKKKFKFSRMRCFFRREYYILIEKFDDIIIVFKPTNTYELIK